MKTIEQIEVEIKNLKVMLELLRKYYKRFKEDGNEFGMRWMIENIASHKAMIDKLEWVLDASIS